MSCCLAGEHIVQYNRRCIQNALSSLRFNNRQGDAVIIGHLEIFSQLFIFDALYFAVSAEPSMRPSEPERLVSS